MPKPKAVPWTAIKKRYLQGESPAKIAEDYEVGPKAIRNKAHREGWKSQKETIQDKVKENVESELKSLEAKKLALAHLAVDTFMYGISVVAKKMAETDNPYRQDGDGLPDVYFVESIKAAKELLKTAQETNGGPSTSRPLYRSIYTGGKFNTASDRDFASKAILPMESGDSGASEWEDDGSD